MNEDLPVETSGMHEIPLFLQHLFFNSSRRKQFETYRYFMNKLWNAARFALMNLDDKLRRWRPSYGSYLGNPVSTNAES